MSHVRFNELLNLKARDAHFVLRGNQPVENIVLIGIDDKTLNTYPELYSFWHRHYADAIRGAALGGAKVLTLDVTFQVPVSKWEPENDGLLAAAVTEVADTMPVVCGFVPGTTENQKSALFAVPLNMLAAAMGLNAFANLTTDQDDFIRRQELLEMPRPGVVRESLTRGMALRTAEKFLGKEVEFRGNDVWLQGKRIPLGAENDVTINFAGASGTFPRVSLSDFVDAYKSGDRVKLESWVKGKAVLLGPDNTTDRYSTPFFTFRGSNKWQTPGVEIHANTLHTLLSGAYIQPVPEWARYASLLYTALSCAVLVTTFPVTQTVLWSGGLLLILTTVTHVLFLSGWLLSTSEIFLCYSLSLFGSIIYRFATAERKSTFSNPPWRCSSASRWRSSLDRAQKIGLTGKRQMVTILFTDIRGFTAFCESKDPAVVVDLLNVYMSTWCRSS